MQANLNEIIQLIKNCPSFDSNAGQLCSDRENQLTKPQGALGRLEELTHWYIGWRGQHPAPIQHPRVAVFAGNHGITAEGVSAFPPEVTAQMVSNFRHGGAAVNQLCKLINADLRVYECQLDNPTANFLHQPALTEYELYQAISYGMMAVEDGIDILALGEMGIGNSTCAAAMALAMFGGEPADWVGRGTGLNNDQLTHKTHIVKQAVEKHKPAVGNNGLKILQYFGGYELAAIAGAVIAARHARVPVILDGYACSVAAACLLSTNPEMLDHCQIGHCSAEPGHKNFIKRLAKKPIVEYEMRLGEASGAAIAMQIIQSAVACHHGMATFAEAMVSNKE